MGGALQDSQKRQIVDARIDDLRSLGGDFVYVSVSFSQELHIEVGRTIWLVAPELTKQHEAIDRRRLAVYMSGDKSVGVIVKLDGSLFAKHFKKLKSGDLLHVVVEPLAVVAKSYVVIVDDSAVEILPSLSCGHYKTHVLVAASLSTQMSKFVRDWIDKCRLTGKVVKTISPKDIGGRSVVAGTSGFIERVRGQYVRIKERDKLKEIVCEYSADGSALSTLLRHFFNGARLVNRKALTDSYEAITLGVMSSKQPFFITDEFGFVVYVNQAACDTTGYSSAQLVGAKEVLWSPLVTDAVSSNPVRCYTRKGSEYHAVVTRSVINIGGSVRGYVRTEQPIDVLSAQIEQLTDYVSVAAHQLRTPLSSINWYTEALLKNTETALSDKQRGYLLEIDSANKHLTSLVNTLLDVSRIEHGLETVESTSVNILKVIDSEIHEQKVSALQKTIKLGFESTFKNPYATGDERNIRIVVQNLLSNAIKYTPSGGKVMISVESYNSKNLVIKIADNGQGIPKSQQAKIFGKMFRADNARQSGIEGTGLGLYLVKEIVESMNGKVYFESDEGKGTTFYVVLPIDSHKAKV
jgi:PAS domain S-box-containing protein